ncbi:MAG: lysine--tRNA ligase [Elusimicrobiales bacterium]|jgi:lysyl-tRNA synthetase class 2|nr:lysine--tRNA ligase [Elusimicrobiales bacterium]
MEEKTTIDEIVKSNYAKIDELKKLNIDPFPPRFEVKNKISEIKELPIDSSVKTAGRIVLLRVMGKASFAHIKDGTGKIQIYLKKDNLGDDYDRFKKYFNVGDFVGVEGKTFKTHTGELTINVEKITILSKSVRPMPEKWHGLSDPETRYRERYLDLISNEWVKEIFVRRSKIISIIREILNSDGYLEVETPILCSQAGGASARPFITFHNAFKIELYMRIATELSLKKLIIGGFDGAYEIGRVFRNEGVDTTHNPEFTTLEAYKAYSDYNGMADLVERLFERFSSEFNMSEIDYDGSKINIKPPFKRISLPELWKERTSEDIHSVLNGKAFNKNGLINLSKKLKIDMSEDVPSAKMFENIMDWVISEEIKQPCFIMDYPTAITPLAKLKNGDESIVERFEFYAGGHEIANAYSELNDPADQKSRLLEQLKQKFEENLGEADILDKDFIEAMEYGMPPTGGIGIGIDRLTMLLCEKPSIREVILFPLLKPKEETK